MISRDLLDRLFGPVTAVDAEPSSTPRSDPPEEPGPPRDAALAKRHLDRAVASLRALLDDPSVPADLRAELAADYAELASMLERIEQGQLHIAVFGRVSVGKSALLNALAGSDVFAVDVLHGTTTQRQQLPWRELEVGGVHLIDTPGIDELSGEDRERLAVEVAGRADLVLFAVDSDMTASETAALEALAARASPMILVLNKADRYLPSERDALLGRLREKAAGMVRPENVVAAQALPASETVAVVDVQGRETLERRPRATDVDDVRSRILAILESEGKTLAAVNAVLFAGELSDTVGERLTRIRRDVAARITRHYCLAKGLAVALNPVPVADLLAAAGLDVMLVVHLSRVYGLPLSRSEAGRLIGTIVAQLAALMGAIWGIHLVSSALKGVSVGASTLVTAAAQGALGWYATLVIARAAEEYLAAGKSWGPSGPKRVLRDIVSGIDRDSVLRDAREAIGARLSRKQTA